jgi:hypothetical protein
MHDRIVAALVGEHSHRAVGSDREQTVHRVGGDHPAAGVEVEAEHAAAGVDEHLLPGSIRFIRRMLPLATAA